MYTITLADGTKLTNLGKNGTNYVSQTKVDESIFEQNLSTMTISGTEEETGEVTETVYSDMVFIQQMEWFDGTFYLAFREKTESEKMLEKIAENRDTATDMQLALTEMYEMIVGGI